MNPSISKSEIQLYKIRNIKFGGWADISIDEGENSGRISISSSHGNWAYYWGSCGESFKLFLCGLNRGYVAGKFGADRHFNLSKTISAWKSIVLEWRRDDDISKDDARKIWDDIQAIENEAPDKSGVEYMVWNSENILRLFDIPDLIIEDCPHFVFFWKNIWSVFTDELKRESLVAHSHGG